MNSESVDFRTTKSEIPESMDSDDRPTVATQVRTSPPRLTNACCPRRSQAYCSTRTWAAVATGVASNSRRPSASA